MITLAIDTSTPRGSVALLENGATVFSEQFTADRSHSAHLFACLERALQVAPHCDRIVVGLGPGSYSGVRIAISAALGMELAMKAELIGLPSIGAMETDAAQYQTIGDARRGTFYYAEIRDGECLKGPELLAPDALRARLASVDLPVFASGPLPDFPSARLCHPSAEKLARLAERGRGARSGSEMEPIYLRAPHITTPK